MKYSFLFSLKVTRVNLCPSENPVLLMYQMKHLERRSLSTELPETLQLSYFKEPQESKRHNSVG